METSYRKIPCWFEQTSAHSGQEVGGASLRRTANPQRGLAQPAQNNRYSQTQVQTGAGGSSNNCSALALPTKVDIISEFLAADELYLRNCFVTGKLNKSWSFSSFVISTSDSSPRIPATNADMKNCFIGSIWGAYKAYSSIKVTTLIEDTVFVAAVIPPHVFIDKALSVLC